MNKLGATVITYLTIHFRAIWTVTCL